MSGVQTENLNGQRDLVAVHTSNCLKVRHASDNGYIVESGKWSDRRCSLAPICAAERVVPDMQLTKDLR